MQPGSSSAYDNSVHSPHSSASAVTCSVICSWSLPSEHCISAFAVGGSMAESLCHWCWGTEATHGWVDGCSCCTTAPQHAEHLCQGVLLLCSGSPRRQQGHPAAHLGHEQLLLSEGVEITCFYGEKRVLAVTTGRESKGCDLHFRKNTWVLFSGDLSSCTCPPTHTVHRTCPRVAWRERSFQTEMRLYLVLMWVSVGCLQLSLCFSPVCCHIQSHGWESCWCWALISWSPAIHGWKITSLVPEGLHSKFQVYFLCVYELLIPVLRGTELSMRQAVQIIQILQSWNLHKGLDEWGWSGLVETAA